MKKAKTMNFIIEGGKKLSGSITTNTAKNCAVGLIAASLLNKKTTLLRRTPKIEEVFRLLEVLHSLGVKTEWKGNDLKIIPPKKIAISKIDKAAATRTRSVIMFIGPLIHEFTRFSLPQAGGCQLGSRAVEPHFFALQNLGIKIRTTKTAYEVSHTRLLKNRSIVLYESGDTVTENVIMAAAKIPGKTVIKFASANYQIQELCHFLEMFGVRIEGIGTTTITIYGIESFSKDVSFSLSEDPIESMLFLSIAATTNSEITIKACPIDFLELELLKLEKMGFRYQILREYKSENGFTRLADIRTYPSKLSALHEKIYGRPFPGLNIDNLPFFVPIATQAKGQTLIHDWVYENRAIYFLALKKLGADILLADPHRVYIKGPTPLKAAEVVCPPALRPAAIILIAMLAAPGISVLRNVYSINRGYEDLAARLRKLGANIKTLRS